MPKLQKRITGAEKSQVVEIPEVVATDKSMSSARVRERLDKACMSRGKTEVGCEMRALETEAVRTGLTCVVAWPENEDQYRIIELELPELPAERKMRAKTISDTGELHLQLISRLI